MALNTAARQGRLKDMAPLDAAPLRWLPRGARTRLSELALDIVFSVSVRPFNRVVAEYGIKPLRQIEDFIWNGYHLLVAEPPGFSNLEFPAGTRFIGPLVARLDAPLPAEIRDQQCDRPLVYFAMGSSGRPEVVARIIAGFAGKPYRVVAPVKNLLAERPLEIPENVIVTGWLPAHQVNRLADISVIHGGIGTVMNACLAGKPVVGVAMSPEQQINLENLAAKGFAIRIPMGRLNAERLCAAIETLLADPGVAEKAKAYQQVVETWKDPKYVRRFFLETFG
jgi:UDP:flavonoid glycosyltransferase YjiC (YdhE family)